MSDPTTDPAATGEPGTITEPDPGQAGTPGEDYQKRYEDLRPQYDRTMQELQTLRQQQEALRTDPEAQQKFLQELGFEVESDEPQIETPQLDPEQLAWLEAQLDKRVKPLEQTLTQAEQDRQIAALDDHFNHAFQRYGKDRGVDLTEDEQAALVGLALTMPPGENGLPPTDKAWESLERMREAQLAQWAEGKRTPHRISPAGAAGTETPDLDDPAQRIQWMTEQYQNQISGS